MNTHRPLKTLLVAVSFVVALAAPALAGPPTEQIRGQVDKALRVLDDPSLEGNTTERHARVRKVIEEIFDYQDSARRALGPHWNARTPQEREEFTRLFADLLDRAYVSKIDLYQGEKVSYLGETINGDDATVKTRIVTPKATEIPVEYRSHLKDGRWKVYDVVIEGVSLISNYRTQFNKVVTTESYETLVQKLRAKDSEPVSASAGERKGRRSDR
jgi:phospholipid transport system substrate-binding protein